jgi:hypothetical protein
MIDTLWHWGAVMVTTVLGWISSVPANVWIVFGTVTAAYVMRGTLFETHALISYHVHQRITEARADREWSRLGSLTEDEFDNLIARRKAWADKKFRRAGVCKDAAARAEFGFNVPSRAQSLRMSAQKLMADMHAIDHETARLLALKARIESERVRQVNATNVIRIRQLMGSLLAADPLAHTALAELNRIATEIDWSPFLEDIAGIAHVHERALNILRRMAGTNSLGEARNAFRTYQQMQRAQHASA